MVEGAGVDLQLRSGYGSVRPGTLGSCSMPWNVTDAHEHAPRRRIGVRKGRLWRGNWIITGN